MHMEYIIEMPLAKRAMIGPPWSKTRPGPLLAKFIK